VKKISTGILRRALSLGCALLLAGCLQERIFWSPDATRAAVLTADGLYLADAAGKISRCSCRAPTASHGLGDSRRLVVAHSRELKDYASIAAALGPDRTRRLATKAESVWERILPLPSLKELPADLIKPDDDLAAIVVYLREKHHDALKEKSGAEWPGLESMAADWHTLSAARITGEHLELGATLHAGLAKIGEIRPAPGGTAVAFVTHHELSADFDDSRLILVGPIDGAAPAQVAAKRASASPDWSSDGRSLWYFTDETRSPGGSSGEDLRFGTLSSSRVLDPRGCIAIEQKSVAHAGVVFHGRDRVRSLRDGRILFNASESYVQISAENHEARDGFFFVAPGSNTVARLVPPEQLATLPPSLADFEISPDEKQILVADGDGKVWLLTLADQRVEIICEGVSKDEAIAPAWRAPGEFTFREKTVPAPN
jgi:hypothetical protein